MNSAVDFETAIAMSVYGASIRSATFWNHGVSVRLACSCTTTGNAPHRGRQPAERRRAVAVQMNDVGLAPIELLQQRRQRRRIELRPMQVGDVDAELVERVRRQVALAQADERNVEPLAVEARDHPREQPLDAVHARTGPPEVVADVDDVQGGASVSQQTACRGTTQRSGDAGPRGRSPDCSPAPARARVVSKARLLR